MKDLTLLEAQRARQIDDTQILKTFDCPKRLGLSPATCINYKNKLLYLSRRCKDASVRDIIFSWSCERVLSHLTDASEETKLVCVASILAYVKHGQLRCEFSHTYARWREAYTSLEEVKQTRVKNNQPTPRQAEALLDWEKEVVPTRDAQPFGSTEQLLIAMYTYIPPRRQLDYAFMHVNEDNGKSNFIHIPASSKSQQGGGGNVAFACFREYKTAKSFGETRVALPEPLYEIIRASLERFPRKYLFTKGTGEPCGSDMQKYSNRILKRLFPHKKGICINAIRHSFASYLNRIRDLTLAQREDYARKMGHSLLRNMEYAFVDRDMSSM